MRLICEYEVISNVWFLKFMVLYIKYTKNELANEYKYNLMLLVAMFPGIAQISSQNVQQANMRFAGTKEKKGKVTSFAYSGIITPKIKVGIIGIP